VTRLVPLLVVVAAACGAKSPAPAGGVENSPAARAVDRSIRAIDWRNRSYDLGEEFGSYPAIDGSYAFVYTTDGEQLSEAEFARRFPNRDRFEASGYFHVEPPVFGDVDKDGAEEAIVTTYIDSGGSGYFSTVYVFTLRGGAPVVLGTIPGGDRADGGIRAVALADDGAIRVARHDAEGGGACCPTGIHHELWRWTGTAFAEDEAAHRLEKLPEPERP
jgi:hypothetical protein